MHFVAWGFLVLQALIVVASLLGYGIFTSRPDLLMQVDPQARFFTWAFHGFAVGNMLFGGLAVVADALLRNRLAALYAFARRLCGEFGERTHGHRLGRAVRAILLYQLCSVPSGSSLCRC